MLNALIARSIKHPTRHSSSPPPPPSSLRLFSLVISTIIVRTYQHSREKDFGPSLITMLAIATALLTTALVPVDIYLVSHFKDDKGVMHVSIVDALNKVFSR